MKKKLISVLVCAALLCTVLATTALAVGVSGPDAPKNGDTISVTISSGSEGASGRIRTSGLSYVSNNQSDYCNANSFILVAGADGTSVTYTYRVSAAAGETVSLQAYDVTTSNGDGDSAGQDGSWTTTVAGTPATDEPTDQPTDQPTQSAEPSQPGASESPAATASASGSAAASKLPAASAAAGKTDKMPKTGDTTMDLWVLAIAAAACVAVGVFAGKKAFANR